MSSMRIGFVNVFPWRPHVEHIHFLAELAKSGGHNVSFLACDSNLDWCYAQALRPQRSKLLTCTLCRIGGIRSYQGNSVHSIGNCMDPSIPIPANASEWGHSSASTLTRYESESEFSSDNFLSIAQRFESSNSKAFQAAVRWIRNEKLDGICAFNGRIDITRAIHEAAKFVGIRFISLERTLFGDGLQLLPEENCLGLNSIDRIVREWRDVPLTGEQALKAAKHIASRFLRTNNKEWRAYNQSATSAIWPIESPKRRILILPSSRNEFWGHPDWQSEWKEMTHAFEALIKHLQLSPTDMVLRCHPNWAERIGPSYGTSAERLYTSWANNHGIRCIASSDKTSSIGLMEQCEAVVVCGGTAAIEAGIMGKQVIATLRSFYSQAGFQTSACASSEIEQVNLHSLLDSNDQMDLSKRISRQVLRFVYTMVYRVPQFVNQVRCVSTTEYAYFSGADPNRLTRLFSTGELLPDDATRAADETDESAVLAMVHDKNWSMLQDMPLAVQPSSPVKLQRRWLFRSVDGIRAKLRRGDL